MDNIKDRKVLIALGAILIIIVLIAWFSRDANVKMEPGTGTATEAPEEKPSPAKSSSQIPTQPVVTKQGVIPETLPAAVVSYTKDGFSPTITTVTRGSKVRFVNNSQYETMWIISDFNPLNQGRAVSIGGTYEFTFSEIGDWLFYNKNNPSRKGRVIVKQN